MHTTIALQPETHDRLLELKRRRRLPSMDAVVRDLLERPTPSAQALFREHEADMRAACEKFGVTRLVAFGSRVRGTARPDSDLDLAAQFPRGSSLFDVAGLTLDLERVLGLRVDLASLGPHLGRLNPVLEREGVILIG